VLLLVRAQTSGGRVVTERLGFFRLWLKCCGKLRRLWRFLSLLRRPPSICQTLLISVIVFWVLWSRFLLSASSASLRLSIGLKP